MMNNLMITSTLLLTLAACEPTEREQTVDPSEWSAIVKVIDQNGDPLSPDDAWWYLPPNGEDEVIETAMTCLDDDCTTFGVDLDVTGEFYVAASYSRDIEENEYCWFVGYDASPVSVQLPEDLSQWSAVELTLLVETDMESCE